MKKVIALIVSLIMLLFVFTGCGKNESFVASLEFDNKVQTLDPQLASTNEDKILIRNLYEGLLREDANGNIVCGAASEYKISNDGLTYTFLLRKDLKWSNGELLTSKDFIFAFKRALSKATKAPYAHLLNDVKKYTADSDYQITITLKRKNNNFIKTLCKPICMPCNEVFFNASKGKYGLDKDHVLTNGSFILKKWVKDGEYAIRISANPDYNGSFVPTASSINISLGDIFERATRLENEYVEFGFVDYTNANKNAEKVTYYTSYDTVYVLLINKKGLLQSDEMRLGIEKAIDREKIKNNLPVCFIDAKSIVPPSLLYNNETYSKTIGIYANGFNASQAGEHYRNALKEYKYYNLSGLNISYYKDENINILSATIAETWQQTINGYVNLKEYESKTEFSTDLYNGKYDFAIIPYTIKDGDICDFLSNFKLDNKDYSLILKSLKNANTDSQKLKLAKEAIKMLANERTAIPLVYSSTVFGASNKYNIPKINSDNGYIDFSLVTQK